MADLRAKAPVEGAKLGDYLHDRARIPAAPDAFRAALGKVWTGYGLGILLALGAVALSFQTRSSWESHREWVVPMTLPFAVLGGLALGHLVGRGKGSATLPAIILIFFALVFTVFNIWRGSVVDGPDGGRDVMTWITFVCYAVAVLLLLIALVVEEWRDPQRPPEPA